MQDFAGWNAVADKLRANAAGSGTRLNEGQKAGLAAIADRIVDNGVILADEVGMGKTRIAVELARAVVEAHGRVAIIVPPGLGFQWQSELKDGSLATPPILRSLWGTLENWRDGQTALPWFEEDVIVVSHGFSNWKVKERAKPWRWALLPELFALWRKGKSGRLPPGFKSAKQLNDARVKRAAQSIFTFAGRAAEGVRQAYSSRIEEIFDGKSWQSARDGEGYDRNGELRGPLEKAVGLCLGCFDLVIIDEAHKSRRDESGLSRMIDDVLLQSPDVRRLAMTATPMELHAGQWLDTLDRVTDGKFDRDELYSIIHTYAQATTKVRASWRSDPATRQAFAEAAAAFQQTCGRYIVRRGKNEDPSVRKFMELTGGESHRREKAEKVTLQSLPDHWLAALCGAEALSYLASDVKGKRIRLTFGNGHGLANIVDSISFSDTSEDARDDAGAEDDSLAVDLAAVAAETGAKAQARVDWWKASIKRALQAEGVDLFGHPAIIKAVEIIEARTTAGEKVLVFGRYTKPLRALSQILNARAMIRTLQAGGVWPQSAVPERGRAAAKAALAQLRARMDLEQLDQMLGARHDQADEERTRLQASLFDLIEDGLEAREGELHNLLVAARRRGADQVFLGNLARAMSDFLGSSPSAEPRAHAVAFGNLVIALRHQNEGDADHDGLDLDEAGSLWDRLAERLEEEYGGQKSAFARMMYGGTKHNTRRLLQFAFNRQHSFPRVLVAQSAVGREGLNLHEACRTVVLLHPEWNPAIAEQQIGRVDRVGSLWARELDALRASLPPDQLRRIEIIPVIFEGTYDEHNWAVLNERWDDLRAQLHGVVVPERLRDAHDEEGMRLIRELDRAAPNFSPVKNPASTDVGN
jgi:hypothetical protein